MGDWGGDWTRVDDAPVRGSSYQRPGRQRGQLVASVLVLFLSVPLASQQIAGVESDPEPAAAIPRASSIDWGSAIRLTSNAGADTYPTVRAEPTGNLRIVWQSTRTPSGSYYQLVDDTGVPLSSATYITSQLRTREAPEAVLGPGLAIDSAGNNWALTDDDTYNVSYTRFGPQGSTLTPTTTIGANDTNRSVSPSVENAAQNRLAVVRTDCAPSCHRIQLTVLNVSDGSLIVDGADVSGSVASDARASIIVANESRDQLAISFGSDNGTFVASVGADGSIIHGPLMIRQAADQKVVRMVFSSDNRLHLLWNESDGIHYARLGSNYSIEQADVNVFPSTSAGFPAASRRADESIEVLFSNGTPGVAALWNLRLVGDNWTADGSNASIAARGTGESVRPEAVELPGDRVAVVFEDTRAGNREIYMVVGSPRRMDMHISPGNELKVPRGTNQSVVVQVTNWDYPRSTAFVVNVTQVGGNGTTISLSSDSQLTSVLSSGYSDELSFELRVDPGATFNESWSMRVEATSAIDASVRTSEIVNVTGTWRAEEQLTLSNRTLFSYPGRNLSVVILIANGGLEEDTVDLSIVSNASSRWRAVLQQVVVQVASNSSVGSNLSIEVPVDGWENEAWCLDVVAVSRLDPWGGDISPLCVHVLADPDVHLSSPDADVEVDPGANATFALNISNGGNPAPGTSWAFELQVLTTLPSGWVVSVNPEVLLLSSNESAIVQVVLAVPAGELAGTLVTLEIVARANDYQAAAWLNLTALVATVRCVGLSELAPEPASGDGWLYWTLRASNCGNQVETLSTIIEGIPDGWIVQLQQNSNQVNVLALAPGEALDLEVLAIPNDMALAGDYDMNLSLTSGDGLSSRAQFTAAVGVRLDLRMSALPAGLQVAAGESSFLNITITNDGNTPEDVTLSILLPFPEARVPEAWWNGLQLPSVQGGKPGESGFAFASSPFSEGTISIRFGVPNVTGGGLWSVAIRFEGAQGAQDTTANVTVLTRALAVEEINLVPQNVSLGESQRLIVKVRNTGNLPVSPVAVEVLVDGESFGLVSIEATLPGESATFELWMNLTVGHHEVGVIVDPEGMFFLDVQRPIYGMVTAGVVQEEAPPAPFIDGFGWFATGFALLCGSLFLGVRRKRTA